MKRIILVGFFVLFIPKAFVHASVVFTEVMYDPQGTDSKHEWVEVYNNGTDSVDLTKYFLQTDGTDSTYHSINSVGTTGMLSPNEYAIIAQDAPTFQSDNSGYAGVVYDSSWNDLSDTTGKTLAINDPNKIVLDQYTYDISLGGSNDGHSLQKNSNDVWVALPPTPGTGPQDASTDNDTTNSQDDTANNTDENSSGVSSYSGNSSTSTDTSIVPQAQISVSKDGIVGVPIKITPSLIGLNYISYNNKSFHISFGDGFDTYESTALPVSHTYAYPGTYVIYFEYLQNPNDEDTSEKLSVRKTIEILPPSVFISNVNSDGSIEISNPSSHEIDMSGWSLRSVSDPQIYFTLPKNTIILADKKITLSKDVTGIYSDNIKLLQLSLPSGITAASYDGSDTSNIQEGDDIKPVENSPDTSNVVNHLEKTAASYSNTITEKDVESETVSTDTNSALGAQVISAEPSQNSSVPIAPLLIGFLGIIIVSVYTIRSLHVVPNAGVDTDFDNQNVSTKSIADKIRIIEE